MLLLIMLCCYQDNQECLCETLSHFVVHLAELYLFIQPFVKQCPACALVDVYR